MLAQKVMLVELNNTDVEMKEQIRHISNITGGKMYNHYMMDIIHVTSYISINKTHS